MHRAIVILRRAINDILDNPVAALRVSVVPLLLVAFVGDHWLERAAAAQAGFLIFRGQFVWWMWALGLVFSLVPLLWMAVGWHRFVLLGERPWPVAPRLQLRAILLYGWWMTLVGLAAIASAFVGGAVLALLFGLPMWAVGQGSRLYAVFESIGHNIGAFLFVYAFLFLSARLVAAACLRRLPLSEAFRLGDSNTVAVFWLTLANLALVWGLEVIKGFMHAGGIVLGGYELASGWFLAMLNIGILTAIVAEGGAMAITDEGQGS